MFASGNASSFLAVCVSWCSHERQTEANLQTPVELSGPSPPNLTAKPNQLVSER